MNSFVTTFFLSTATIIYAALYNFSFSGLYARFDIWLENKLFVYDIYNYVLATKCHCTDKDDKSKQICVCRLHLSIYAPYLSAGNLTFWVQFSYFQLKSPKWTFPSHQFLLLKQYTIIYVKTGYWHKS